MDTDKLLLEAQSQTIMADPSHASKSVSQIQDLRDELNQVHLNVVTRIHEIEIQNYEILKKLDSLTKTIEIVKADWERKYASEKNADVLLRNVGILSYKYRDVFLRYY